MIRFRHFAIAVLLLIVSTGGAFAYIPCGIPERSVIDHADPLRRPIAELDGSGTLIRRFIWGRGVVAQVEADGTAHYFHHDGQGSTLALSDTSSVTTDTWFYSPYGEVMSRTGSTETPYQWCGGVGVRRTANGLYFSRHRYYHPELKRWIARDPIGLAGGGNLYAYGLNSPWLYYDPYGLCAERNESSFRNKVNNVFDMITPMLPYSGLLMNALDDADNIYKGGSRRPRRGMSWRDGLMLAMGMTSSSSVGKLIGKGYPAKLNAAGRLQPYNPATGRYLSYSVNPGVAMSPLGRFSAGFAQGWAESQGASGATPVGSAGSVGHALGGILGNIF